MIRVVDLTRRCKLQFLPFISAVLLLLIYIQFAFDVLPVIWGPEISKLGHVTQATPI